MMRRSGVFLQNASHELKTPLMAIQGYAEGIRDGIFKGEEKDRVLDVISVESMRLKKLVDELVYLSKLETLDAIYHSEPTDPDLLVKESIMRVESLAVQKGVAIRCEREGDGGRPLQLDPDKMIQALINLLANGIRHARQQVTVRLVATPAGMRITVADDGAGLQEGEKERIFDRFVRGSDGDTGLGLAITKAIIEKSGGHITAGNLPSGGAIFTIDIPNPCSPF